MEGKSVRKGVLFVCVLAGFGGAPLAQSPGTQTEGSERDALLAEVRMLRAVINQMASASIQTQLLDKPDVGFIHQSRGLQLMPRALSGHIAPSEPVKLSVHQLEKPAIRTLVATTPREKERSHVIRRSLRKI